MTGDGRGVKVARPNVLRHSDQIGLWHNQRRRAPLFRVTPYSLASSAHGRRVATPP